MKKKVKKPSVNINLKKIFFTTLKILFNKTNLILDFLINKLNTYNYS